MFMRNMCRQLWLLIFGNVFLCVYSTGWFCLRQRKRSQRSPRASVVSASKYRRSIAGDVESPSILSLLLLPLLQLRLSLPYEGEAISAAP